jgi:hypothetical protein
VEAYGFEPIQTQTTIGGIMKVGDLIGHAYDIRIKGIVIDFYPNGMVRVFWTGFDKISSILPNNLIVLSEA